MPERDTRILFRACLRKLVKHRAELETSLSTVVNEGRLFLMLLALEHPITIGDVRTAALSHQTTTLYERIVRLQHRSAAYQVLDKLVTRGIVTRTKRNGRIAFRLRLEVRSVLADVLATLDTGH